MLDLLQQTPAVLHLDCPITVSTLHTVGKQGCLCVMVLGLAGMELASFTGMELAFFTASGIAFVVKMVLITLQSFGNC